MHTSVVVKSQVETKAIMHLVVLSIEVASTGLPFNTLPRTVNVSCVTHTPLCTWPTALPRGGKGAGWGARWGTSLIVTVSWAG